jgi:hypothetical protein
MYPPNTKLGCEHSVRLITEFRAAAVFRNSLLEYPLYKKTLSLLSLFNFFHYITYSVK